MKNMNSSIYFLVTVCFCFLQLCVANENVTDLPPDFGLNISEFLEKHQYPLESHEVTTEDGYILTLHRIPYGQENGPSQVSKPAILLMHGLLSSSMDWVNMGPGKSLALVLADQGYDVWLGNQRGNTWSRKHVELDPNNGSKFWEFSFHEIGVYDLTAKIDYILSVTGHEQISYVGHSQGTTSFMAMAATKPEFNDKINLMVAYAPVAYMSNLTSPLVKLMAKYSLFLDIAISTLQWYELFPYSDVFLEIGRFGCNNSSPTQSFCSTFIFLLCGFDEEQLDTSFLPMITSNAPAGASYRQMKHYTQEVTSGYFRQYDYGFLQNMAKYGSTQPPSYNTSLITAPMALYYSENDWMSNVINVEQLIDELPNVVNATLVPWAKFNHLDFLWAKDVDTLLNNDAVALINKYNNK